MACYSSLTEKRPVPQLALSLINLCVSKSENGMKWELDAVSLSASSLCALSTIPPLMQISNGGIFVCTKHLLKYSFSLVYYWRTSFDNSLSYSFYALTNLCRYSDVLHVEEGLHVWLGSVEAVVTRGPPPTDRFIISFTEGEATRYVYTGDEYDSCWHRGLSLLCLPLFFFSPRLCD